jgi:transposase
MDSKRETRPRDTRRRHSDEFKQTLVARSLMPGASVAAIAQEAGVNANLLFNWRRLHLQAQLPALSDTPSAVLLPVKVVAAAPAATPPSCAASVPVPRTASASTIEIDISGARVRVRGPVDEASLRVVLRTLARAG